MSIKTPLSKIKGRVFNYGKHVEWFYGKILRKPIVLNSKDGYQFEFQPENSFARHINRKGFTDDNRVLEYIKKYVKPGDVCFDVGACFGVVSLCMAKYSDEIGRVFSFEAEEKNYFNLKRNVEINHFKNVKAFNSAVYSHENGIEFNVQPKENYGDHSIQNSNAPGTIIKKVNTIALDDFCKREKIEEIDCLKLDVEGVEPDVLIGASSLLENHNLKRIIFEISQKQLNNFGYNIEYLTGLLTEKNYTIWELNDNGSLKGPMSSFPITNFDNWVALAPNIDP